MWNRKAVVSSLVIAALAFAGACTDVPPTQPLTLDPDDPEGPDGDVSLIFAAPAGGQALQTLDARYAQLAQEIPGFGGLYFDEVGNLNVHMVATEGAPRMSTAELAGVLDSRLQRKALRLNVAAQRLVVHEAKYDFRQLHGWHQDIVPVLTVPGVVFTDVDERTNRLQIGVEPGTSQATINHALQQLGVPLEAVSIIETDAVVPVQSGNIGELPTLQDRVRPVAGGLQINFTRGDPPAGFLCTLGFNARAPTLTREQVFFTNSHCTDTRGEVLNTPYWQHSRFVDDTFIGVEIFDPPFFTGGPCPEGRNCRFSDAAVGHYQIPRGQVAFGQIYRPFPGTRILPDVSSRFTIVGELSRPVLGQALVKVGRTTGLSGGAVIATCGNSNVAGEGNITMLCQDWVGITIAGGDSGSPVVDPIDERRVRLAGLLWGSSTLGGGSWVMSAMENIRFEIPGPWITH